MLPGLGLLALAAVLGWPDPQVQSFARIEYGGAFMPPDLSYLIACVGEILLLFWIVDRNPHLRIYRPVEILGTAALFVYVAHSPLIEIIEWALGRRATEWVLFPILAGLLLVLLGGVWLLARVPFLRKKPRATS